MPIDEGQRPFRPDAFVKNEQGIQLGTVTRIERDAEKFIFVILGFAVIPLNLWVFSIEVDAGRLSLFLIAEWLLQLLAVGLGLLQRWRGESAMRVMAICFAMACQATMLHFGPHLSSGLAVATAVVIMSVAWSYRGAFLYLGASTICFLAVITGELSTTEYHNLPADSDARLEMFITFHLALIAIAVIFSMFYSRLKKAVLAEEYARRAAQQIHAEREEFLEKMASAQRLESLGRLAGGVAHDFNNVLAVLQMGVCLLSDEDLDKEETRELLEDMTAAIDGANSTTRQLRAFARGAPENEGTAEVNQSLKAFQMQVSRILPADVHLKTSGTQGRTRVGLSAGAIEQMFLNLCLNAQDAGAKSVNFSAREVGEYVEVAVTDDGEGIEPELLDRICEPFVTTRGSEGTGMGLAMVHGTIQQAGGRLEIDSAPGVGTTVRLYLPISTAPVSELIPEEPGDVHGLGLRVLVVEDRAELLRAVTMALSRVGFEVTTAQNLKQAREQVKADRFDLLCTDGILPDGRAPDVIEAFKEHHPDARVILFSGYLEDELIEQSLQGADYHFLAKPFEPAQLCSLACAVVNEAKPHDRRLRA